MLQQVTRLRASADPQAAAPAAGFGRGATAAPACPDRAVARAGGPRFRRTGLLRRDLRAGLRRRPAGRHGSPASACLARPRVPRRRAERRRSVLPGPPRPEPPQRGEVRRHHRRVVLADQRAQRQVQLGRLGDEAGIGQRAAEGLAQRVADRRRDAGRPGDAAGAAAQDVEALLAEGRDIRRRLPPLRPGLAEAADLALPQQGQAFAHVEAADRQPPAQQVPQGRAGAVVGNVDEAGAARLLEGELQDVVVRPDPGGADAEGLRLRPGRGGEVGQALQGLSGCTQKAAGSSTTLAM